MKRWSSKRLVFCSGAAAVTLLLAWLLVRHLTRQDPAPAVQRPADASAAQNARTACELTLEAYEAVRDDASADRVLALVAQARQAADQALLGDAAWVQLDSSVQSLERAVTQDDGPLARLAIRLTAQHCAALGVRFPGLTPGASPSG